MDDDAPADAVLDDAPASRAAEVPVLVAELTGWARLHADVDALALVGSYARDAARPDSDVDLVVLSDAFRAYADDLTWFPRARPGAGLVRARAWGPVLERRWRLPSGLLVELGFTGPGWASVPLDAGTARVLADGCRPLHDPRGLLARAIASAG